MEACTGGGVNGTAVRPFLTLTAATTFTLIAFIPFVSIVLVSTTNEVTSSLFMLATWRLVATLVVVFLTDKFAAW